VYEFSRLLTKFGIQVLFDIRPKPPPTPAYSRSALEQLCSTQKINYVYLGNELQPPAERNDIKDWRGSEAFKRGLKIIAGKVPTRVCCLVCSCYQPDHCHRLVITNELAQQGIEVIHILEENRFWSNPRGRPLGLQHPRRTRTGEDTKEGYQRDGYRAD